MFAAAVLLATLHSYEFTNGQWFDGSRFVKRTMYTNGSVLTTRRPKQIDRTVDLAGKYVVPPFGEAHNHHVEQSARLDALINQYLHDGVFYVKNPNVMPRTRPAAGRVNVPSSVDVIFAPGSLTGTDGHPVELIKRNIDRGVCTAADGEGAFYFQVDSLADLDRKWPALIELKPDFVKTYLLYSEEYAARRDDPKQFGWKGLNPALLPEIVERAHAAGLTVATHVETGADFHNAVVAGVDEINHTPGFRAQTDWSAYRTPQFRVADADAELAAKHHVTVVTTLGGAIVAAGDSQIDDATRSAIRDTVVSNLQTLRKHGVNVVIGSDSYRGGVLPEVDALRSLGIFTSLDLLRMWSVATPKAIFPKRKIGELRGGYEATFLVLDGNPLDDFTATRRIVMRIKDGEILEVK
jgi:hypothetical protein